MRLEPGYHVTPHVRLVRLLRKGGMGSVWAAEHLALRTQVAVKFMSAALVEDEAMVTRFTREAAFAAQIKSPHVVQIHDHGITEDAIPFIVMELLEGEDLAERVRRAGPLSVLDVARLVSQLCRALSKAHQAGIIHRDLKLNNVFLVEMDGDIFAKLLDFGIAKQRSNEGVDVTTTGAMVGTLAYMSPEQLHNAKEVDFRSDLWSLAVVAYRALTGRLPFREEDGIGALLTALNAGVFLPPSALRPDLPEALDAWFLKGLSRNPAARFASAREMAEEFDLAIGRESTAIPSSRRSGLLPATKPALEPPPSSEPGTSAGVVHAQTVASVDPTPGSKPRGMLRVALAGLALGVVGALSVAVLGRGGPSGLDVGKGALGAVMASEPAPPGQGAAPAVTLAVVSAVASPAAAADVAPAASVEPSPWPSPLPSPSSAPATSTATTTTTTSASAAPASTAGRGARPRVPPPAQTGTGGGETAPAGPIRKEKDYGF